MQQRQTQRKEACIGRANDQCIGTDAGGAGNKWEERQFLGFEPVEGFFAQCVEGLSVFHFVTWLVSRLIVGNDHAVRIAATHVGVDVVGGNTVLDLADRGFNYPALTGNVVGNFQNAIDGIARSQFVKLFLGAGYGEFWAGLKDFSYRRRDVKA